MLANLTFGAAPTSGASQQPTGQSGSGPGKVDKKNKYKKGGKGGHKPQAAAAGGFRRDRSTEPAANARPQSLGNKDKPKYDDRKNAGKDAASKDTASKDAGTPKPKVKTVSEDFVVVPRQAIEGEEADAVDPMMLDFGTDKKKPSAKALEKKKRAEAKIDPALKIHRGQKARDEAQARTEAAKAAAQAEDAPTEEVEKPKVEETEKEAAVFTGEKFEELPINDKLKQALAQNSFTELTEIQKKAIPVIIKEKNVIMKSETGSGKTLAYLVPLIEKLSVHSMQVEKIRREYGTYCIIFSPTRELCAQIDIELQRLTSKMFAYMICSTIMGGENPKKEKARLRKGVTVLVCTPGRFLYHLQNTENLGLSRLQYLIIDEADRMLDMGFEKEMNECLSLIKRRCQDKFADAAPNTYHSEHLKVNFISATLSSKVQTLGAKLMQDFKSVGFQEPSSSTNPTKQSEPAEDGTVLDTEDKVNIIDSIPRQVKQYWLQIPTQYRLLYLLAFLYAHQHLKVIVFASNCETVNLLTQMCKLLDWNDCVNRRGGREREEKKQEEGTEKQVVDFTMPNSDAVKENLADSQGPKQPLFNGHVFKLHGDMDHSDRKVNFFGFDKDHTIAGSKEPAGSLLICTDVASRGLDFKRVDWVLQWDLSSHAKEYVNRVGRTARIASAGQSLCFVMGPTEVPYVAHMRDEYGVQMTEKSRFTLMKAFEERLAKGAQKQGIDAKLVQFRKLKAIDDPDEKQESLHCLRQLLTSLMMTDKNGIKDLARVAKNSSTRAYAGHAAAFRHILNKNELNLTEYARSFGIYKVVHNTMSKSNLPPKDSGKKGNSFLGKRKREEAEKAAAEAKGTPEGNELFTRRLQKSKLKELQVKLNNAYSVGNNDIGKIKQEMERTKKAVFTDEKKLEQRKKGFERAKHNVKATVLSEFM